jgi:hypothetical protein
MAILIGSNTQVTGDVQGVISAQWGISPQINRLWQLGSWDPYSQLATRVTNVSLTIYAGGGPTISLQPATACVDSSAILNITITPGSCGIVPAGLGGSFTVYLSSYSYNKGDAIGFGQQSYSGQTWPGGAGPGGGGANVEFTDAPTVVLQGRAEGTSTIDSGLGTGVNFSSGWDVYGTEGSVSAGFPGTGQANEVRHGLVDQISNGDLRNDGKAGQASVTIPHQPLYFG